jgi:sodium-coupled neutral amino acid transporter 2
VVIIAGVTIWKLVAGNISWPRLTPDVHDLKSFWRLFTVIPVMVTAYICHHNVHPIANELAGTADEKMRNVVRWSMFLCGGIYVCTATFGYLLFGDGTSDDILSNFDTDLGVPFSEVICVIVRISYAVHIMLVYPLLNFSLRLNLDAIMFPRATPLVLDSVRFSLITGFLLCCVFLGAAIVPNIWIAFQFTGATCTVCLGFIFPALVLLRDKPLLATRKDKLEAAVMVTLAIVSSVVAVTTDVFNLLEPGNPPADLTSSFI